MDKRRNLSISELDEIIQNVSEGITRVMDKCIPKREIRIGNADPIPEEVEILMKKRRSALKEKRRGRDNGNLGWMNLMHEIVKETTREINQRLTAFENEKRSD